MSAIFSVCRKAACPCSERAPSAQSALEGRRRALGRISIRSASRMDAWSRRAQTLFLCGTRGLQCVRKLGGDLRALGAVCRGGVGSLALARRSGLDPAMLLSPEAAGCSTASAAGGQATGASGCDCGAALLQRRRKKRHTSENRRSSAAGRRRWGTPRGCGP